MMRATAIQDGKVEDTSIAVIPRPSCLLCEKEGKALYNDSVDWLFGVLGSWGLRTCIPCGIAWLDPQPKVQEIPRLYSRYHTHHAARPTRFENLRREGLKWVLARMGYHVRGSKLLPRLLSYLPSVARAAALEVLNLSFSEIGTLLDVGCGSAAFIERMRSLGWNVRGVEPDPAAVDYGRRRGLEVFAGTISDLPDDIRYDVITLNHVIEHVSDPIELLRECGKRLRPKSGRLILTTPNINSLGHWWFKQYWRGLEVPRHLILFSPAGLRECMVRAGLRVRLIRSEPRIAHWMYTPSVYAKDGERMIAERLDFRVTTKVASYLFQFLEDIWVYFKRDAGEEIFACAVSAENS